MERIDRLEEKEKDLETRLANLETTEKELRDKLRELGEQIKEVSKGNLKKKAVKRYIPKELVKAEREIEGSVSNKKIINGAEPGFRKDLLEKQIKDVMQKYPRRQEETLKEDNVQISDEERRKILKNQIGELIEKFDDIAIKKDQESEREVKEPIKEVKIKTDDMNLQSKFIAPTTKLSDNNVYDARILFELLLRRGMVKSDDAANELKIDKKTIYNWTEDLEKSGLIEVTRYPYGVFELRLKDISVAIESKKK